MADKEDGLIVEGVVTEALRGGKFRVEVAQGETTMQIEAHLAGKMRQNNIRVVPGDRVRVEVSAYDIHKGRILFRMK